MLQPTQSSTATRLLNTVICSLHSHEMNLDNISLIWQDSKSFNYDSKLHKLFTLACTSGKTSKPICCSNDTYVATILLDITEFKRKGEKNKTEKSLSNNCGLDERCTTLPETVSSAFKFWGATAGIAL